MPTPTFDKTLFRAFGVMVALTERTRLDPTEQAALDAALDTLGAARGRKVAETAQHWLRSGQPRYAPVPEPKRMTPDGPIQRKRFEFNTGQPES